MVGSKEFVDDYCRLKTSIWEWKRKLSTLPCSSSPLPTKIACHSIWRMTLACDFPRWHLFWQIWPVYQQNGLSSDEKDVHDVLLRVHVWFMMILTSFRYGANVQPFIAMHAKVVWEKLIDNEHLQQTNLIQRDVHVYHQHPMISNRSIDRKQYHSDEHLMIVIGKILWRTRVDMVSMRGLLIIW